MKTQFAIIDMQEARHAVIDSKPRQNSAIRVVWEESGESESIVVDKDHYFVVPYLSADFWQLATPIANGRFMKEHPLEFYVEVLETLSKGTGKVITLDALAKKVKDLRGLPKATLGRPNLQTHEKLKRLFRLDEKGLEFSFRPDHGLESLRPLTIVVEPKGAAKTTGSSFEAAKQYFAPASHFVPSEALAGLTHDVEATAALTRFISDNTPKWSITEAYENSTKLGNAKAWSQLVIMIAFGSRPETTPLFTTWTSDKDNALYFAELANRSMYSNLHSISERTNFANLANGCFESHSCAFTAKLSETGFADFLASFADLAHISETKDYTDLVSEFVNQTQNDLNTDFVSGLQKVAVRMLKSPNVTKSFVATEFFNTVARQRRLDLAAKASSKRKHGSGQPESLTLEMEPSIWLSGFTFELLMAFNANDEFARLLQRDHFKQRIADQIAKPFASESWDSGKFHTFFSAKKWLQTLVYKNVPSDSLAEGIIRGANSDDLTQALFGELVPAQRVRDLEAQNKAAQDEARRVRLRLSTVEADLERLTKQNSNLVTEIEQVKARNHAAFEAAVAAKGGEWLHALDGILELLTDSLGSLPNEQILALALQVASRTGLNPNGHLGEIIAFDANLHECIGVDAQPGSRVQIIVPGSSLKNDKGQVRLLRKAIVKVAY